MVFKSLTVWVLAKRSMRFYEKNVQYNDRTDKKLESLFPHSRHLLPPTDRGEEESLTAIVQNSVSLCFSIPEPAKDVNLRCLHSGQTFDSSTKIEMTVWIPAKRSSRFYGNLYGLTPRGSVV